MKNTAWENRIKKSWDLNHITQKTLTIIRRRRMKKGRAWKVYKRKMQNIRKWFFQRGLRIESLNQQKKVFVGSHEHTHCTHVILLTLWGLKCFKDFIRDYNLILIATSNANFHKKNFRLPKLLISFDLLLIYSFSL